MGHSPPKNSQKDVLALSEEAEMFQPTELNRNVSGSKLWDWETVSMPAAYLQTLCANAMPCFPVTVPIICSLYSLVWYPTSTDQAALLLLLWYPVISCNVNCEPISFHSAPMNQSQNYSSLQLDLIRNFHSNKQCWDHYPKWDVKADKTISLNWLSWILPLTDNTSILPSAQAAN